MMSKPSVRMNRSIASCAVIIGGTLLSGCQSIPTVSAQALSKLVNTHQAVKSHQRAASHSPSNQDIHARRVNSNHHVNPNHVTIVKYSPPSSNSNPHHNSPSVKKQKGAADNQEHLYAKAPVHWEYEGDHGPEHWAALSEDFSTCATGRLQSPIDIKSDMKAALPNLTFVYQSIPMKIINNGHTIQVDQDGAGHLSVNGKTFELKQFHFHSPSEHKSNGRTYPLEMHLVHASKTGELAVVGVMFKAGAHNEVLEKIWSNMPTLKGETLVKEYNINAKDLLPSNRSYSRFMGSLTTPPCSEGVNWHMMQTPIMASAHQIHAFTKIYPNNARPLQEENNRLIVEGVY